MDSRLERYGWNSVWASKCEPYLIAGALPARIVREGKGLFHAFTEQGTCIAEISGGMRNLIGLGLFESPVTGDWCAITPYDKDRALIEAVLPRESTLHRPVSKDERRIVKESRAVAANIDLGAVIIDGAYDASLRRAERFFALLEDDGIPSLLIFSKADLSDKHEELKAAAQQRFPTVPVLIVDSLSGRGKEEVEGYLDPGRTIIMLGASGAGKSTLINMLAGKSISKTGEVRTKDGEGRHTTTARELHLLENGALLIDTPGIRSIGTYGIEGGSESVFSEISALAVTCRFSDCTHTREPGCAVLKALEEKKIDPDSYENFLTFQNESMSKSEMISKKREKEKNIAQIKYQMRREK